MSLNLGQLISELRKVPSHLPVRIAAPMPLTPTGLTSYRGYYDHLAITYRPDTFGTPDRSAGDLLAELIDAVGAMFVGYKGGKYVMSPDTPVWVADHGRVSDTLVGGIVHNTQRCWIELEVDAN